MSALLKYSGIVTKVKSMSATLLTKQDYTNIAQATTVVDVVSYLKSHPAYMESFSPLDHHLLHRGDIEKVLIQSLYTDYSKLYSFGSVHVRNFLRLHMRRYEIDLINYCFRIVSNHYAEPFDLSHKREFFDKYSTVSINKLITSTSLTELVDNLKDTEYYLPLKKLQDKTTATLFDYNLALDLYYYTSLWRQFKKLFNKREASIFTKEVGLKIDILNAQWIYRSKKYYNLSAADIYALLIPVHYHLKKTDIKLLVEASTIDDFNKLFLQTYYGKHYVSDINFSLETMYHDCLFHCYATDNRKYPYSLAPINMYLYNKEEEIKKLITALECIRYGIGPTETLNYIGGIAQ